MAIHGFWPSCAHPSLWGAACLLGLSGVCSTARAQVIYNPIPYLVPATGSLDLDLNHDGVIDLSFPARVACGTGGGQLAVAGFGGGIASHQEVLQGQAFDAADSTGDVINAGLQYRSSSALLRCSCCEFAGGWVAPAWPHFMRFVFESSGHRLYAWVAVTRLHNGQFQVLEWAYQSDPSLGIQPGEGRPSRCGSADFNGDGDVGTDSDIQDFFNCIGGNCCDYCGSADYNRDGDVGTDADIEMFFRMLSESC